MPAPLPSWGNGAVRFDPDLFSTEERRNLRLERRGLSLLMIETWKPATDLESELPARRALLERWATADQAFRDSYLDRTKASGRFFGPRPSTLLDQIPLKKFICVAEVDKKMRPENYKKLLKILILCYMSRELAGKGYKGEHAFQSEDPNDPHLPTFLQITDPTTLDYSLSLRFLENADVRAIETTRSGKIYLKSWRHWFFIDQEALDTGRVRVVDFTPDGAVWNQALLRPFDISSFRTHSDGLAWDLQDFVDRDRPLPSKPIDLDVPLTDILLGEMKGWYNYGGNRESWQNAIELCAPGYLELEAQGRELEYDLDRFVHPSRLYRPNIVGTVDYFGRP